MIYDIGFPTFFFYAYVVVMPILWICLIIYYIVWSKRDKEEKS